MIWHLFQQSTLCLWVEVNMPWFSFLVRNRNSLAFFIFNNLPFAIVSALCTCSIRFEHLWHCQNTLYSFHRYTRHRIQYMIFICFFFFWHSNFVICKINTANNATSLENVELLAAHHVWDSWILHGKRFHCFQ